MIELLSTDGEEAEIRIDGRTYFVPYIITGNSVHFVFDGETYLVELEDKTRRGAKRQRDHSMEAPMPGVVLKMFVKAGDVVQKGAPLLILEAMKMEHQLTAPRDGKVVSVNCTEGELVQPGVELVTLEEVSS